MRPSTAILRGVVRATPHRAAWPAPPTLIPASLRTYHLPRTFTQARPSLILSKLRQRHAAVRHESSIANAADIPSASTTGPKSRLERDQVPAYEMTFTCKKCDTRSSHRISKQGYHHGTVLITCPGCKNRHLMSDHLKIFSDKPITLEDILREKGQLVKRGTLDVEGDVEFWDDNTQTPRSAQSTPNSTTKSESNGESGQQTDSPATQKPA